MDNVFIKRPWRRANYEDIDYLKGYEMSKALQDDRHKYIRFYNTRWHQTTLNRWRPDGVCLDDLNMSQTA